MSRLNIWVKTGGRQAVSKPIAKSAKYEIGPKSPRTEGPYRRGISSTPIFSIYFVFQAILSKKVFFGNIFLPEAKPTGLVEAMSVCL